jgi:hypothetical protein
VERVEDGQGSLSVGCTVYTPGVPIYYLIKSVLNK